MQVEQEEWDLFEQVEKASYPFPEGKGKIGTTS
jgi:hypothetical protein